MGWAYVGQILIAQNLLVHTVCYSKFVLEWFPEEEKNRTMSILFSMQMIGFFITMCIAALFIGEDDGKNVK